ncbi:MAG: hypothetical protein BGN88_10590 [Clostridiales bacterium 43-6]|nr:MAG: hypothetical protein BGN88_10590 [Clostridiales bacterium 43-6]
METLALKIADKIAFELGYDSEKKMIVQYGLFGLIQIVTILLINIIIGLLFNILFETLTMTLTSSILRKYSGGAHLEKLGVCTLLSVAVSTIFPLMIKSYYKYLGVSFVLISIILVFVLSFFLIYKLAPIDNPNKPIKTERKRKRMRKGSFIVLIFFMVVTFLLFILGIQNQNIFRYCWSILIAILWQVFSLTKLWVKFYHFIDFVYCKIKLLGR